MLVVLWQRTPYLIAALVGPLAAISLYQRAGLSVVSEVFEPPDIGPHVRMEMRDPQRHG